MYGQKVSKEPKELELRERKYTKSHAKVIFLSLSYLLCPVFSRTAQIEQKLDGLVALLANSESNRGSSTPALVAQTKAHNDRSPLHTESLGGPSPDNRGVCEQSPITEGYQRSLPRAHKSATISIGPHVAETHPSESLGMTSTGVTPVSTTGTSHSAPYNAVVDDLVDSTYAEELIEIYREMSDSFPFVMISSSIPLQEFRSRKPMLFLAVLMTAANNDRRLQITLEENYRRELATKTIVNSHRSLDCLQSILVYLAWYGHRSKIWRFLTRYNRYHFYFTTQTQQIYQLLQIAIAMAVELGISHKPRKPVIDISANKNMKLMSPEVEREAQRAFLGCYHLSAG